jgi:hypothetical protein
VARTPPEPYRRRYPAELGADRAAIEETIARSRPVLELLIAASRAGRSFDREPALDLQRDRGTYSLTVQQRAETALISSGQQEGHTTGCYPKLGRWRNRRLVFGFHY